MDSRSGPFLFFFSVVWSHALQQDSPVPLNITCSHQQAQCVLPCPCPPEWMVLQWTRPDLKKDGYVWDQREGYPHSYLHPSYRGRVQPGLGCDVVLTNTSSNYSGEYECRVLFNTPGSSDREESCHVVQLKVEDPPGGHNREQRVEEDLPRRRDGVIASISLTLILLSLLLTYSCLQRKKEIRQKYRSEVLTSTSCLKSPDPPNPPNPPNPQYQETNVLHRPEIV